MKIDKYPGIRMYLHNKPKTKIYIAQMAPPLGPVKIGITRNVKNRFTYLKTGSPFAVKLLCSFTGDHEFEKELHRFWSDYRMKGEWFHPVQGILNFVNEILRFEEKEKIYEIAMQK